MEKDKIQIQNLIIQGELEEAFREIKKIISYNKLSRIFENEVVVNLQRVIENERRNRMNIIENREYDVERNKLVDAALKVLKKIENKANDISLDLFLAGKKCVNKKEYDLALVFFSNSIESSNDFFEAYIERGAVKCLVKIPNYESAIQDFNKALEIRPNHFLALLNRGVAYFYINQIKKACEDWLEVRNQGYSYADKYLAEYHK